MTTCISSNSSGSFISKTARIGDTNRPFPTTAPKSTLALKHRLPRIPRLVVAVADESVLNHVGREVAIDSLFLPNLLDVLHVRLDSRQWTAMRSHTTRRLYGPRAEQRALQPHQERVPAVNPVSGSRSSPARWGGIPGRNRAIPVATHDGARGERQRYRFFVYFTPPESESEIPT